MKAKLEISGVSVDGLARLGAYLQRVDLQSTWESKRLLVRLVSAHIEEGNRTYLVTVEMSLIDSGSVPGKRMYLSQFVDFFRALEPTIIPEFLPNLPTFADMTSSASQPSAPSMVEHCPECGHAMVCDGKDWKCLGCRNALGLK